MRFHSTVLINTLLTCAMGSDQRQERLVNRTMHKSSECLGESSSKEDHLSADSFVSSARMQNLMQSSHLFGSSETNLIFGGLSTSHLNEKNRISTISSSGSWHSFLADVSQQESSLPAKQTTSEIR